MPLQKLQEAQLQDWPKWFLRCPHTDLVPAPGRKRQVWLTENSKIRSHVSRTLHYFYWGVNLSDNSKCWKKHFLTIQQLQLQFHNYLRILTVKWVRQQLYNILNTTSRCKFTQQLTSKQKPNAMHFSIIPGIWAPNLLKKTFLQSENIVHWFTEYKSRWQWHKNFLFFSFIWGWRKDQGIRYNHGL